MTDRIRQPKTMSDRERVEMIFTLRRRGWTYARIGRQVGLSANGVKYALHRETRPGRYIADAPEEVDDL
jgi:lambda repressor-like predicted transcriptional regulator